MEKVSKSDRIWIAIVIVCTALFCMWCVRNDNEKGTITGEVYKMATGKPTALAVE